MGDYGPNSRHVEALIRRAGSIGLDDAVDLYQAHGARLVANGDDTQRRAIQHARHVATRTGRVDAYERARRDAASAFRGAQPMTQGPWLLVSQAITNAAGALVLADVLDREDLLTLLAPWRQAVGDALVPVGPGSATSSVPARLGTRR
jgi:hypothetical protein